METRNYWLDKKNTVAPIPPPAPPISELEELLRYKNVQIKHLIASVETLVAQVVELKKKD